MISKKGMKLGHFLGFSLRYVIVLCYNIKRYEHRARYEIKLQGRSWLWHLLNFSNEGSWMACIY